MSTRKITMNNLSVFGVGKLGLCFALQCEQKGYNVLGIDVVDSYVRSLNEKSFLSDEPGVSETLKKTQRFQVTLSIDEGLSHSDYLFVFVPTPTGLGDKSYDHSILSHLLQEIVST